MRLTGLVWCLLLILPACGGRPVQESGREGHPLVELSIQFLLEMKLGDQASVYRQELEALTQEDLNTLVTDAEKISFWLNVYNALTQEALLFDPSLYEDKAAFFKAKRLPLAGKALSLDDIEHGLLRRSRNKYSLGYLPKLFVGAFERKNRVNHLDPRIHFALNCGASGCPPIAFFEPPTLEQELQSNTVDFLQREAILEGDTLYLTPLMSWFRADFGGKRGIYVFLEEMGILSPGERPKLVFTEYDWTLEPGNFRGD
jgi:hypothetical protein